MIEYFTDPILRAPTIGTMLMGASTGIVGVLVLLRREALLGETLSHASFPGAIAGLLIASALGFNNDLATATALLLGAIVSCLISIKAINLLTGLFKIPADAALCFVLAATFGIGVTSASNLQFREPSLYRQALSLLYGQAATMRDIHIYMYLVLLLFCLLTIIFFYKEIQSTIFDGEYALTIGIPTHLINNIIALLIVLALVVSIRTVGVVLVSAMLIAPPITARQFTNKMSIMIVLSSIIGALSAFLGIVVSVAGTDLLQNSYYIDAALPTGPSIVIVAAFVCLTFLLIAPQKGLLSRLWRIAAFRLRCLCENILKYIWRNRLSEGCSTSELAEYLGHWRFVVDLACYHLRRQGWLVKGASGKVLLSNDGIVHAQKIIRLHRLWEVYLVDYLGLGAERVHYNAEEMEHIITPDVERQLTAILNDPKRDPHLQPIPPNERL